MNNQEAIEVIKLAQAQIEWDYPMDYTVAFDMAISALQEQESKHSIESSLTQNALDLVSRQAAIDALGEKPLAWTEGEYELGLQNQWQSDVDALNDLPSAQPEVIRCKDCRHGVDYYHEGDCYCSNPKWGLKYFGGSWEFYCADAERRTDD